MKTLNSQKYLFGTAAYIKIPTMDTKGCGQLISNETYFADRWCSGLKTYEEVMAQVVQYCRPVKTSLKGFLSSYIR